jgi:HrpA-like RNA helicase
MAPESLIGYIVGPNFNIKAGTRVVFMTENEFLSQTLRDKERFLETFDTFVIDEAHELRKPQLLILAIVRNLLRVYPHKRVIVTSATLEASQFREYFKDFSTCLIEAKTPTFGVEITYNQYPDLETNVPENTLAHLKLILDVRPAHRSTSRRTPSRARPSRMCWFSWPRSRSSRRSCRRKKRTTRGKRSKAT